MLKHKEFFDLSNFPKNSKIFCNDNKKIPEKMKDEYRGTAIYEYAGTKSKMCSILDVNNYEKSVHKGHDEFIDTLVNKKIIRHNMKGMKPFNHRMYTYESNNIFICFLMISDKFLIME